MAMCLHGDGWVGLHGWMGVGLGGLCVALYSFEPHYITGTSGLSEERTLVVLLNVPHIPE